MDLSEVPDGAPPPAFGRSTVVGKRQAELVLWNALAAGRLPFEFTILRPAKIHGRHDPSPRLWWNIPAASRWWSVGDSSRESRSAAPSRVLRRLGGCLRAGAAAPPCREPGLQHCQRRSRSFERLSGGRCVGTGARPSGHQVAGRRCSRRRASLVRTRCWRPLICFLMSGRRRNILAGDRLARAMDQGALRLVPRTAGS